jgi:pyruvate,orthophosphate dikinase
MSHKYVYLFKEGSAGMKNLLGGKGANLAEMSSLGLPVPPGFIVTTEACTDYHKNNRTISEEIIGQIESALSAVEDLCGKKFGDLNNPFLVSVRSGARASMPGMMDTILNLGLNDVAAEGLAALTGNDRFAYDSYRRFIQMFSDVVMDVKKSEFEKIIDALKKECGVEHDIQLTAENMRELVARFKALYMSAKGESFPQDPKVQLFEAIKAVFRSWDNPRAIYYRRMNDIPGDWGTAVNVQAMVFGNMGDTSGTGVAFTRDPSTGENKLYGEYLINAQGEDVVAGVRTPRPIATLRDIMPDVYREFTEIAEKLEKHYRDMQDMEYTIERGKLYMLQTRNGKRTAAAALKIAVDLVSEGMLTREEAVIKVDPRQLDALLHPQFDAKALKSATPIARGLAASPGAACGRIYFETEACVAAAKRGEKVLLVRPETSPEDIEAMNLAEGLLTARGGMTSHAAVVARGMGTCCVAGCGDLRIDEANRRMAIGELVFNEGVFMSLDGSTGNVYAGEILTVEAEVSGDFATLMQWADGARTLKVRTNADTPHDAAIALKFGAEGIGLTRTEHMFFASDRINIARSMILADNVEQRKSALDKLLPMQKADFKGIYAVMGELPVTIRFLDPPLHEFLPRADMADEIAFIAGELGVASDKVLEKIHLLHELNPMMGPRGCRLSISYPEIAEMQARAIMEAAIEVSQEKSITICPELMIPLTGIAKELEFVRKIVVETAERVIGEKGFKIPYLVGTMLEIPRAALTADKVAEHAEFFSFGTNDLTQMTYGFSRDDAGKFLEDYYDKKILESDPFARIDVEGVGKLIELAVKLGREAKPGMKMGICGEHGGDPSSVAFCHDAGLDYVSCSPFRVPIAKLAAAQAAIEGLEVEK